MPPWVDFFRQKPRIIFLFASAWTLIIFIGCSLPGRDLPGLSVFDHFDKVVHFVFFLVFVLLWGRLVKNHLIVVVIAVVYGFFLEFYQMYFVAGRSFDVWDGVADGVGALIALIIMRNKTNK